MWRLLFCLAFSLALVACRSTSAADAPKKPQPAPVEVAAPAYPVTPYPPIALAKSEPHKQAAAPRGRKKLEALLQTVADLDYGDRQTVTVREVFNDLHRKHQLSIRLDMPTLSVMFGVNPWESIENDTVVISDTSVVIASENAPGSAVESEAKETPAAAKPKVTENETNAGPSEPAAEPAVGPANSPDPNANLGEILMNVTVKIQHVDTKRVTIATILRHTLDALPVSGEVDGEFAGLPIKMTNASNIDYVVEDDGLLITTRMNAMTVKETRVYSIKHLKDVKPEELAKVIRQSIRPWSWRSQINDLGDQLKAGLPSQLPPELTSLMASGLQLASAATGISVSETCSECDTCPLSESMPTAPIAAGPYGVAPGTPQPTLPPGTALPPGVMPGSAPMFHAPGGPIPLTPTFTPPASNTATISTSVQPDAAATMIALNTLVNGLVTFAHASLSALEMLHFADPPTGTIQTLPGKLIITQSQAAHRDITELLKQLEEE